MANQFPSLQTLLISANFFHPVQSPGVTQGKGLLNEVVAEESKRVRIMSKWIAQTPKQACSVGRIKEHIGRREVGWVTKATQG